MATFGSVALFCHSLGLTITFKFGAIPDSPMLMSSISTPKNSRLRPYSRSAM
jgi:hypothetical protein